jgi:hypothetical protein
MIYDDLRAELLSVFPGIPLPVKSMFRLASLRQRGYTAEHCERDFSAACGVALMLADNPKPHLERLLRVLMENVVAYHQGVL